MGPIGNCAQAHAGVPTRGLGGQFAVELMLGGPRVSGRRSGAAALLAARAEYLGIVALTMLAFGLGTALPQLAIGMMSREALSRWRGSLLAAGSGGKMLMGSMLVVAGTSILTGIDKRVEANLVDVSPIWLTELTTRF